MGVTFNRIANSASILAFLGITVWQPVAVTQFLSMQDTPSPAVAQNATTSESLRTSEAPEDRDSNSDAHTEENRMASLTRTCTLEAMNAISSKGLPGFLDSKQTCLARVGTQQ
jgi:hypothetical protein